MQKNLKKLFTLNAKEPKKVVHPKCKKAEKICSP